ncbi:hypothetical protein MTO96_047813 [Rhipicephalus appendiculatus]
MLASAEALAVTGGEARVVVVALVVAVGVHVPVRRTTCEATGSLVVSRGAFLEACLVSSSSRTIARLEAAANSMTQAYTVSKSGSDEARVANDSATDKTRSSKSSAHETRTDSSAITTQASQDATASLHAFLIFLLLVLPWLPLQRRPCKPRGQA